MNRAERRRRERRGEESAPLSRATWTPGRIRILLFVWSFLTLAIPILTGYDRDLPYSVFLAGDAEPFLGKAGAIVSGEVWDSGLPFHPPLTSWLLVPLASAFAAEPATLARLSKLLMALLAAGSHVLLYELLRRRNVSNLLPALLLAPLAFPELVLSTAAGSELPYRLLLLGAFLVGLRRPVLLGLLSAAAVLCRAEHLFLLLPVVLLGLAREKTRKETSLAAAVLIAGLLPATAAHWISIGKYDREHAAELAEPLPRFAPVTIYGPVNFALAQLSRDIHFSREALPVPPNRTSGLEMGYPPHNRLVIHGYSVGFAEIRSEPGRFVERTFRKIGWSLRALAPGFTWRDLPKPAKWVRQPVDLALSSALWWEIPFLLLVAAGGWFLRKDRALLAWAAALLASRLLVNALFFPYLRSVAILLPLALVFALAPAVAIPEKPRKLLLFGAPLLLALVHLVGAASPRDYVIRGPVEAPKRTMQDQRLEIELSPGR